MLVISDLAIAREYIKKGRIIAYPTEAVFGLGCCPFNEQAVMRLLEIKQRPVEKGMILLISNWQQLIPLVDNLQDIDMGKVEESWPGPTTWIFPKSRLVPEYLSGNSNGIAIRMSAHKIASELCKFGPLISTSANVSNAEPARTPEQVQEQFAGGVDAIVVGSLGSAIEPSAIYDVLTNKRLR